MVFTRIFLAESSIAIALTIPLIAPFEAEYIDPPTNEQKTPDIEEIKTEEDVHIESDFEVHTSPSLLKKIFG